MRKVFSAKSSKKGVEMTAAATAYGVKHNFQAIRHELLKKVSGQHEAGTVKYVIVEGTGTAMPKKSRTPAVVVQYTGTYAKDGKVFDSSRGKGESAFEFTVGLKQVIPCFDSR